MAEIENSGAQVIAIKEEEQVTPTEYNVISTYNPDPKSDNHIKNTKYNLFTFLPKVFFLQIKEPASMLFFIIMMLQISKTLAIGSFSSGLIPFLFVFFMSMINEGMDDVRRYRRDKEVNAALYKRVSLNKQPKEGLNLPEIEKTIVDPSIEPIEGDVMDSPAVGFASAILSQNKKFDQYEEVKAMDIKVGDIILVNKGQKFPADCVLLTCNDENGELFIRTDQLDGETDWKRRQCSIEIPNSSDEIIATVEKPDKDIYSFTGKLEQTIGEMKISLPLDLENTAWADTVAATSDALGVVIYTGLQTRAKMNTYMPRNKQGVLDKEINAFVLILGFLCMICACCFSALRITKLDGAAIVTIVRFIILFSFMIPIALKVTLDTGRTVYAYTADKKIVIRNTGIQEDLARISFFLTDKTGTLTQNEMLMKKLHLGINLYDKSEFPELKEILRKFMYKKKKATRSFKEIGGKVFDIIECLALCHNVTPVETEEGIALQASSPDEIALVEFVRMLGFELIHRDRTTLKICYQYKKEEIREVKVELKPDQEQALPEKVYEKIPMEYKIHHVFPFNSDTKRMGIILERDDDSFVFFEKGADTAMKKICKDNDWAEEETDDMARDGLRTLLIGKKEMPRENFEMFNADYNEAKLSLHNRQQNMLESQKRLEKGLDLLGLTGVEDKLQDNVKETLESLRNAGIKVWMLTGDKIETAISIAKSSRLLDKLDNYLIISGATTENEIREKIDLLKTGKYNSLVIDGISLAVILDNKNAGENKKGGEKKNYLLESFVEQTKELSAVIGCRYTPTQKAMMAASLKTMAGEIVMCIGDGGNDVSMITEADAGVGIEGKEGNQAALSADFSLKKFCHVTELMFAHGRNCYVKSAELAKITLRRAFLTTIIQAVFSALVNCVPLSIFQGYMGSFFILFTCFPILTLYHDSDIKKEIVLKYPELYKELRMNRLCSLKEFILATLIAYLQATLMTIGYMFILKDKEEMHFFSILVFTSAVLNEHLTVLLFEKRPKTSTILVVLGSLVAFGICTQFFSEFHINVMQLLKFTHKILLINIVVGMITVFQKIYHNLLNPASHIKISKYNAEMY